MSPYRRALMIIVFALGFGPLNGCLANEADAAMAARIAAQLTAGGRNEYDAVKDPGRKPLETMRFFGLKAGMTVLDMIAGGGYNSEILSAAVGPDGTVYAQNSHGVLRLQNGALHDAMIARLAGRRLANVKYMVVDPRDMPFSESIDVAVWGFNMHDFYNGDGEAVVLDFLTAVKRALKPGGILAISDHIGVAGNDNADLHRLEPRIILDMLKKAGFTVEATSDLLANPDDDHSRSVYADGLRYATDRILVRARKAE